MSTLKRAKSSTKGLLSNSTGKKQDSFTAADWFALADTDKDKKVGFEELSEFLNLHTDIRGLVEEELLERYNANVAGSPDGQMDKAAFQKFIKGLAGEKITFTDKTLTSMDSWTVADLNQNRHSKEGTKFDGVETVFFEETVDEHLVEQFGAQWKSIGYGKLGKDGEPKAVPNGYDKLPLKEGVEEKFGQLLNTKTDFTVAERARLGILYGVKPNHYVESRLDKNGKQKVDKEKDKISEFFVPVKEIDPKEECAGGPGWIDLDGHALRNYSMRHPTRSLMTWGGTLLPVVLGRPEVWLFLAIHIVLVWVLFPMLHAPHAPHRRRTFV